MGEAVVKTHLREIRQALGDNAKAPRFIETVHRRGYRFIAAVHHAPAPAQSSPPRLLPSLTSRVVGRQVELARLHESLERALGGQRQVVLVTGEPGIGKTTLVKAFLDQLQDRGDLWLTWGQCIEPYGAGEAYLPVLEALGRLGRGPDGERIVEVLTRQAPSWLAQMPGLLTAPEWATLRRQAAGATPERMLREMAEALEALSDERLLAALVRGPALGRLFDAGFDLLSGATVRPGQVAPAGHVSTGRGPGRRAPARSPRGGLAPAWPGPQALARVPGSSPRSASISLADAQGIASRRGWRRSFTSAPKETRCSW